MLRKEQETVFRYIFILKLELLEMFVQDGLWNTQYYVFLSIPNILKSDADIHTIFKSFETHLHLIVKTSEVGSTPYLNSLRADEMKTADVFSSISACSESSIIAHWDKDRSLCFGLHSCY